MIKFQDVLQVWKSPLVNENQAFRKRIVYNISNSTHQTRKNVHYLHQANYEW
jgi:hypothetical protein